MSIAKWRPPRVNIYKLELTNLNSSPYVLPVGLCCAVCINPAGSGVTVTEVSVQCLQGGVWRNVQQRSTAEASWLTQNLGEGLCKRLVENLISDGVSYRIYSSHNQTVVILTWLR